MKQYKIIKSTIRKVGVEYKMTYRLMFVEQERENLETVYRFDTIEIDGVTQYREFTTEQELDTYIEDLLNDGGYAKKDFIVVSVVDYDVEADIFVNTTIWWGEKYE